MEISRLTVHSDMLIWTMDWGCEWSLLICFSERSLQAFLFILTMELSGRQTSLTVKLIWSLYFLFPSILGCCKGSAQACIASVIVSAGARFKCSQWLGRLSHLQLHLHIQNAAWTVFSIHKPRPLLFKTCLLRHHKSFPSPGVPKAFPFFGVTVSILKFDDDCFLCPPLHTNPPLPAALHSIIWNNNKQPRTWAKKPSEIYYWE